MAEYETRLKEICDYLHNYFVENIYEREFSVLDGHINIDGIKVADGQYCMIEGSVFNDAIFMHPSENLKDEVFVGAFFTLRIPPDVRIITQETIEWEKENEKVLNSPLQSESFGGYSYSKATSQTSPSGQLSWRDVFADRLARYKKL